MHIIVAIVLLLILIYLFRLIIINFSMGAISAEFDSHATEEDIPDTLKVVASQLKALGFAFIGLKLEKLFLRGITGKEWSFASSAEQSFASLIFRNNLTFFYFYTPFQEGGVVLTANDYFPPIRKDSFVTQNAKSNSVQEVFTLHKKTITEMKGKGLIAYKEFTTDSRIIATKQFYAADEIKQDNRKRGFQFLILIIVLGYFIYRLVF